MCGFDDGKKKNNTISNERKLVFFPFKCTLWVPVTIASSRLNLWTRAQNYNASLTLKVDLNLRFSLKSSKVYYNRFSYFKVDLKLRKYLNI